MSRPVFYITRLLPGYRIPILEALNQQLGGRLIVGHGHPPRDSSLESLLGDVSPGFEQIELTNYWFRGETLHAQRYKPIFREYGNPSVVLVEESPRSVTLPFLLRYAKKQNAGRVLWGHFSSNNRQFSPWHPLDRYRLTMAQLVESCVCYSSAIKAALSPHIDEHRLFVARNTIDTDQLLELHDTLDAKGKQTVRNELDLAQDKPVLVFLGRLIPKKGTRQLLKIFQRLREKRFAQLLVIGDGPDREAMEQLIAREKIPDVRFTGAVTDKSVLGQYLYAADVMLIPGYLGLAVNDAFAFGLPVISTQAPPDRRFHSPEVAYIDAGENGELVPTGDITTMVDMIEHVLEHQKEYSANALGYAREHLTLDRMVSGLVDAINYTARSSASC